MADNKQDAPPPAPPAAPGPPGGEARFARRIVDTSSDNQEGLSAEQVRFIRQTEVDVWRKSTALRSRNVLTGLAIGAVVAAIYGYTFYSVSQERIMDELDEEAKRTRMNQPRTGAN